MLIIKKKQPTIEAQEVSKVTKSVLSLDLKEKVDRYGDLKLLLDSMKSTIEEFEVIKADLVKTSESEDAASEVTLRGDRHIVTLGAKPIDRKITDVNKVRELLGDEVFMKLASVTLTNIDKYISEAEQSAFIKTSLGKRRVKSVVQVL